MQRKHQKTLKAIFNKPISGSIKWSAIEALFIALGAEVSERAGSRVAIVLDGEVQVYHRPHPQPTTDKGAVASVRKWLDALGYSPINDDDVTQTAPVTNDNKE
ncbi:MULTISPECIES: type II toxin-antitoxin system HicA family toxin [unclassified Psychrobacter]|uniref:type II toxin-antitoxin system HicA family toxin n=1 Tax=unclassified Psychrobacter TaxID=196806 RepID=UPI003FD545E3